MRNYDLTLVISPLLEHEEANDRFQGFVSFVQEQGGILADQRLYGKKPLLAPIRGAKEGFLATLKFAISETKLSLLEKRLKETEQVLRFFIARQEAKARQKRHLPLTPAAPIPAVVEKKEEKVDMKDIDQQLEEIFK